MEIPEIIAHRGTPRECRENTLPSFGRALEQAAAGIELDVHITRDNVVIVHHDATIQVADVGGAHVSRALSAVTFAELRALPGTVDEAIPTLDDVLALVARQATVYIEVKAQGMEQALVRCLTKWPDSRVAVHAFDHRIPVRVRAHLPGLSIGLLSASYPLDISAMFAEASPSAVWQQAELIDESFVSQVHAFGARVIAWTVNDPAHAEQLVRMGVDGLCSDTPGRLRRALAG